MFAKKQKKRKNQLVILNITSVEINENKIKYKIRS